MKSSFCRLEKSKKSDRDSFLSVKFKTLVQRNVPSFSISEAQRIVELFSMKMTKIEPENFFTDRKQVSFLSARIISRLLFERFLIRFPRLKYLQIVVDSFGSSNLIDADRWENFFEEKLLFLKRFDFNFRVESIGENFRLEHFDRPFWKNGSFVVFNEEARHFFTVPRFAQLLFDYPFRSIFSQKTTNLPSDEIPTIFNELEQFHWNQQFSPKISLEKFSFPNVRILSIKIERISTKNLVSTLKNSFPNVSQLKIDGRIVQKNIHPILTIRVLEVPQGSDFFLLSQLFPSVERLSIRRKNLDKIDFILQIFPRLGSISLFFDERPKQLNFNETSSCWVETFSQILSENQSLSFRVESREFLALHFWFYNREENFVKPSQSRCCLLL